MHGVKKPLVPGDNKISPKKTDVDSSFFFLSEILLLIAELNIWNDVLNHMYIYIYIVVDFVLKPYSPHVFFCLWKARPFGEC